MVTSGSADFVVFTIGIVAGILVAFGLDLLRYYFFRPQLEIEPDRPEIAESYSIHSLVIHNSGKRVALNAQGFISFEQIELSDIVPESDLKLTVDLGVDEAKFGVSSPETIYLRGGALRELRDEPLCWAAVDSRSRMDIYPDMRQLLDVCRFVKLSGYQQLHLPSRIGWQHLLVSLRPRSYRIWITAMATDARRTKEKYTIEYEGDDIKLRKGWAG